MEEKEPEIINIVFGSAGMYLPKSKEWIAKVRKLLDLLEADLKNDENELLRQEEPKEPDKSCSCSVCKPKKLSNLIQDESGESKVGIRAVVENRPQSSIGVGKESVIQSVPIRPEAMFELIRGFEWDKSKEKSYRTIFFVEMEDGRVGLSYFNSKVFTTKEAVLSIPFPVPYGYTPLRSFSTNRRTAIRHYREYLFNEAHNMEVLGAAKRGEGQEEKDAVVEREEVLRRRAEINQKRWTEKLEKEGEMSEKTKELRKAILNIDP